MLHRGFYFYWCLAFAAMESWFTAAKLEQGHSIWVVCAGLAVMFGVLAYVVDESRGASEKREGERE